MKASALSLLAVVGIASAQDQCGFPTSAHKSGFESGEQVSSVTLPPDNTPLVVTINGPADGATVNINAVQYYGTYTGPSNSGVSINKVAALTNSSAFVVPRVVLVPGPNTITLRYASTDNTPVTSTRTITYVVGAPPNVSLTARSPGDYAPTRMPFVLATALPVNQTVITRVQVDFNGDGTFEIDSTAGVPLEYAFEEPGFYAPKARVTFDDGNAGTAAVVIEDTTHVLIQSLAFTRQTLCRLYGSMKSRLAAVQIPLALNTVGTALQPRFQTLWTEINQAGQLPQVASKLGLIVDGQLSRNAAEMRVAIPTSDPAKFKGYSILFRRDISGVWRIEGM